MRPIARLRPALAVPVAVLALVLAGCAADDPVATDPADEPSTSESEDPSTEPSEDPESSEDESSDDAGSTTTAAYFIGDTERAGPRLYREFQRASGEPLEAAVEVLTAGPLDPDYRTAWQSGQLISATYDGDYVAVVVDPSVRKRPSSMSKAEATAAIEQVIYTVQAALQERAPVQFRTVENPIDMVFGRATSEPLVEGDMLDTLSHMSVTAPEQGAGVDGDVLRASGVGNGFEATVAWRILHGDEVIDEGAGIMDGWMGPKLFPWELEIDVSGLAPGDYTFWATTDDPTGGTEGIGAMTDDKDFTIE